MKLCRSPIIACSCNAGIVLFRGHLSHQTRLCSAILLAIGQIRKDKIDHHVALSTRLTDTSDEAERVLVEAYRRMSPAQRIHRVRELIHYANELALSDIRRRHPQATERELQLRLASRRLDPALLREHFGWDVTVQGY